MAPTTLQRADTAISENTSSTAATPATMPETTTMRSIDQEHSTIGFSVKHMKFATVHGQFAGFRGTVQFDADRPRDARVTAEIDTATIETGIRKRDDHL